MRSEDFRLIQEFVAEKFGIIVNRGKETYLSMKLLPRLRELGFPSFYDYYAYLKFSPRGAEEQRRFISLVTNNETYFFREEAQLKVFAEQILPLLKKKKADSGSRRIRIVSAGCSTGEEAYTLSMLLLDSGSFFWDWDVRVIGVDVDEQALEKAEAGIYSGRAFQTLPQHYRDRYFREAGEALQVRDILRKMTTFVQGNLLELGGRLEEPEVDIIFCRNVLIYFNDATVRRIVEGFAGLLKPDGYLFLGHSESLSRITGLFQPVRFPGAIIYRLREHAP
jgi:chemotaxis protein methyltransferase CheR